MKNKSLRWIALGSLALNLLLVQVISHQGNEAAAIREESASFRSTIARLEADLEARDVELAVINALDDHRLRVTPVQRRAIALTIVNAAQTYDLDPELILGVIFTESSFVIDAESDSGALGLMQLMPATASQLAEELEMEWRSQDLLTDPQVNILLGSFYLRKLIHRFDNLDAALAAYNMGPNRFASLMARNGRVRNRYPDKVRTVSAALKERFFGEPTRQRPDPALPRG